MHSSVKPGSITIISYILMAIALLVILRVGLLGALFSGLLVYSLVHLLAPALERKISSARARMIAAAGLGILVVTMLSLAIWGAVSFFQSDAGNIHVLLKKMADIIDASRNQIPAWLRTHLPDDAEALREMIAVWLREHAAEAKIIGEETGRAFAHILIGMIIGAMVAMRDAGRDPAYLPLAAALRERIVNLKNAFQQIVFAQVRIAAINAVLTTIYIFVILPISGISLPLSKSLIVITFVAGLLPVIGNLISNTVLVIVAMSHSLQTAMFSLLFLIIIHKLEYFLNARIIGFHIQARAWELLIAMLLMESIFGMPGVIAAPVFYAYIKKELMDRQLV
ncbi:MAG TPA: AI-2E family transporter [Burkholderiaceae bacterium]|nr:AI-2E family transporter [Burkholderiaceae bacterium]